MLSQAQRLSACRQRRSAQRRFSQVVEERAEITHDTELRRNTEAHVIATTRADESPVGVIEVKIVRELIGRRLAIEPAVTAFLGLGQKADGHGKVMQKSWCFTPGYKL